MRRIVNRFNASCSSEFQRADRGAATLPSFEPVYDDLFLASAAIT